MRIIRMQNRQREARLLAYIDLRQHWIMVRHSALRRREICIQVNNVYLGIRGQVFANQNMIEHL
ncbi:hypothetical protein D3C77_734420 [compost metagenome]